MVSPRTERWGSDKAEEANAQGKYKKGAGRINLLMGVSGDEQDPFEFHHLYTGSLNT